MLFVHLVFLRNINRLIIEALLNEHTGWRTVVGTLNHLVAEFSLSAKFYVFLLSVWRLVQCYSFWLLLHCTALLLIFSWVWFLLNTTILLVFNAVEDLCVLFIALEFGAFCLRRCFARGLPIHTMNSGLACLDWFQVELIGQRHSFIAHPFTLFWLCRCLVDNVCDGFFRTDQLICAHSFHLLQMLWRHALDNTVRLILHLLHQWQHFVVICVQRCGRVHSFCLVAA